MTSNAECDFGLLLESRETLERSESTARDLRVFLDWRSREGSRENGINETNNDKPRRFSRRRCHLNPGFNDHGDIDRAARSSPRVRATRTRFGN